MLWWKGHLAADIHQTLRLKELKLSCYKGHSPQIGLRRYFADLIAVISNHYRLCPTARHLAVYLLDLFMDRYDISVHQLHVVALSCLLLASKFEEKEDHVPKLEQLNALGCITSMNVILTKQNLLDMELLLLETFQWNICLPTAAHFIDYYLSIAVHEADVHDGWPIVCLEKTKLYMAKYANYFLEVSLQDHEFLNFAPSIVAAACIASSRIVLHLTPTWPTRLHRLTAYSWDLLVPCIERLILAHDSDVKEAQKQKIQTSSRSPALTVFQNLSQVHHPSQIPQHVVQHLQQNHQTRMTMKQEQPSLSSHSTGYSLQSCPLGLQAGIPSHGHMQAPSASVPLPGSAEIKPCIGVACSRNLQVNGHYSCTAPCFER